MLKSVIGLALAAAVAGTFTVAASAREPGIPKSERLFQRLDKNKDGSLAADELRSPSERRFMSLDKDKDGTVTAAEIDAWLLALAERRRQRILEQMDGDGDGAISRAEVAAFVDALFALADADGNGGVTMEEVRAYHATKRRQNIDARKSKSQGD